MDINLIARLPPFMQDYSELQELYKSQEPEFELLNSAEALLRLDIFIMTATETGLARYEKMLGIVPLASHNLEYRRVIVLSLWNNFIPYTMRWLINFLIDVTGDNFDIVPNFKEFELTIILFDTRHIDIDIISLAQFLRRILPVNLVINYQNQIPYINGNINIGAALTQTVKITIPADYEAQVSYDIKGTLNTGTTLTQALTITI